MNKFDTFTLAQKEIYTAVHDLEQELMNAIDPATFTLNPKVVEISKKIDAQRAKCAHIYEDGHCIVCGQEEQK